MDWGYLTRDRDSCGLCEQGKDPSLSIKFLKPFDHVNNYKIFSKARGTKLEVFL